jgi:hypothetical protein
MRRSAIKTGQLSPISFVNLKLPEMKEWLCNIGMDVRGTTPEEFAN